MQKRGILIQEKGNDAVNKGIWKRFMHMCKVAQLPYVLIGIFLILNFGMGAITVMIPQINGNFFAGDVSVKSVAMFIGFELLSTLLSQLLLYVNHITRYRINFGLRNALWGKILKLKPSYYDQVSSSTLISRITMDADGMNEFILDILIDGGYQIYLLVLTIFAMSAISIKAGLMLLIFLPISIITTFIIGRLNLKFENRLATGMADLTDYLSELMSCLPLLKSVNMQKAEAKRGNKVINDYFRQQTNVMGIQLFKDVLGQLVGIGPELTIILIGIHLMKAGTVDAAGWYTFYLYAGTFVSFYSLLCTLWENMKTIQGKMYKITDVLYEEEETVREYTKEIVESGDIIFDRVSFAYDDTPVLEDASFTIPRKRATVIAGHSGTGKSTILKLIERMYLPTSGRIMESGCDINEIKIDNWRKQISYVTQNTPLLSGTIRENILYGIKREVGDEEIMEAAKLARLDRFLKESPKGLDTQVGEFGGNLSGGQRQKISITRAILAQTEILLFDEPTASLDIISTEDIAQIIEILKKEKTVITVTHDGQIARRGDHVILVNSDHSVMEGSQEQMQKMSHFYQTLLNEESGEEGVE